MKKIYGILLIVFLLTSCDEKIENNNKFNAQETSKSISTSTNTTYQMSTSSTKKPNEISQNVIEDAKKYEFLTSFDGCEYRREMLMFAKAYFNSNENEVKKYLIEPESVAIDFSHNDERHYSDIDFVLIKFDNIDETTNIAHAQLEYKWENIEMYYYLDITMKQVDDSWMVVNYFIEG